MKITQPTTQLSIRTYFVVHETDEYDVHVLTWLGAPHEPFVLVRGQHGWRNYPLHGEYQGDHEAVASDAVLTYLRL